MARTKARVAAAHAERQRAPGEALVRKRAAIAKAARVMSVQEVEIATLEREVMHTTRAPFRTNATLARAKLTVLPYAIGPSQVQKLGPVPAAEQIIKLSGQTAHGNGVIRWRGRLRGGGERALEGSWVRRNFKASFLSTVLAAGGTYQHIPTGRAQERPPAALGDPRDGPEVLSAQSAPAISAAECPLIAYRQGNADLCVAFGLASAVHAFGDAAAGAAIASCARAALASGDAFGHVRTAVRETAAGWSETPLARHDPLALRFDEPVLMQLVGSDGAGTHAVVTLGGLVFDAAEARALPLSRATLDRCVGIHRNGAMFSHVARAVRLVPGKSVHKWLQRGGSVLSRAAPGSGAAHTTLVSKVGVGHAWVTN